MTSTPGDRAEPASDAPHQSTSAPDRSDAPDRLQARIDAGAAQFRTLPTPTDPADLTTTQDVQPGPDPQGGRDADNDWLLRYGAG